MLSTDLLLPFLGLATLTSAATIHVASYAGPITSFNFTRKDSKTFSLDKIGSDNSCGPNATWLDLDNVNKNLFCLDEGISLPNGSVNSFQIQAGGTLKHIARQSTLAAPAQSIGWTSPQDSGKQFLAVAQYSGGLTTWHVDPSTAEFSRLQTFQYKLLRPGANPRRQDTAHPHQATVDPSGKYLVVPDLGADLLRVYYIDPASGTLQERVSFPIEPGAGPRHGTWLQLHGCTYYYLVTELKAQLLPFKVDYADENQGLSFTLLKTGLLTYGDTFNETLSSVVYPGEVLLSKDNKHLYASNRRDAQRTYTAPNGTVLPSDTIAHYTLSEDGVPTFAEITTAGGSYVRSFALSPDGKFAAVPLQRSGTFKVFAVDKKSGKIGEDALVVAEGLGNVTSVVWADSTV